MFAYPANIVRDGDGFFVSFPDIPEAVSGGSSREEAIEMGRDALQTAMDFYFEDRRAVPQPSPLRIGQVLIELPTSVFAKVLLLNEIVANGLRPVELARKLEIRPQEVTRLLDLHHPTKIDTIASALQALGKRLELRLV